MLQCNVDLADLICLIVCLLVCLFVFSLQRNARTLLKRGVTVIPVIIGSEVTKENVKPATDDEDRIELVQPTDAPKDVKNTIDEQIKKAIKGTCISRSGGGPWSERC